jgi:hypothetical protein
MFDAWQGVSRIYLRFSASLTPHPPIPSHTLATPIPIATGVRYYQGYNTEISNLNAEIKKLNKELASRGLVKEEKTDGEKSGGGD